MIAAVRIFGSISYPVYFGGVSFLGKQPENNGFPKLVAMLASLPRSSRISKIRARTFPTRVGNLLILAKADIPRTRRRRLAKILRKSSARSRTPAWPAGSVSGSARSFLRKSSSRTKPRCYYPSWRSTWQTCCDASWKMGPGPAGTWVGFRSWCSRRADGSPRSPVVWSSIWPRRWFRCGGGWWLVCNNGNYRNVFPCREFRSTNPFYCPRNTPFSRGSSVNENRPIRTSPPTAIQAGWGKGGIISSSHACVSKFTRSSRKLLRPTTGE
jgi:hypothetical protein